MCTHRVWVPRLLCSTPGYSPGLLPRGNLTRGNALWVPLGNRGTGCREKGRGWRRRGGVTYNPCAWNPGLAASQVPAVHRHSGWHRRETQGDHPPPPQRRLVGNFKPSQPPDRRNPLFRSVRHGQSHSGSHTTKRSPAPGFLGRGSRGGGGIARGGGLQNGGGGLRVGSGEARVWGRGGPLNHCACTALTR